MHVLYLHQHFSTRDGSTGTRSYEFARRLIARGHSVTMVCGSYAQGNSGLTSPFVKGKREGTVDGIHVIELELPYSNADGFLTRTMTFVRFVARSIGKSLFGRYDVIFATTTPLTAGIPGIAASILRRKPFVFEVRDLWPELPKAMGVIKNPAVLGAMSVLEWCSYRSAHRCIGLAPGIVQGIAHRGVADERIHLIPNASDLDLFGDPALETWRPDDIATTDFMAVFTGTHGQANGLHAVLDAARVLKARGRSDIKLLFIGDGKMKPELIERASKEGLDNCRFHAPVPKRRLAGLLRSADAGLMILANVPAFYRGTSPNKFFDYAAAGLPVLNNYPGWAADMISDNKCGIAVPPENAEAFADALVRMAADRVELRAMGARARQLAEASFDRDKLANQFVDVLERTKLEHAEARSSFAKRAFDIVAASGMLLVLSPVLIAVALMVRRRLGTPVLFSQVRPGLHGKPFRMYKFRSMTDARDASGALLPDSERLPPFGQKLRSTSLDELPELWNVLKGDMSLVGPRPLLVEYLNVYTPEEAKRHDVRPGLTGWAQINGRNAISWDDKLALDVWYVKNRSFWLDVKILFKTALRVVKRDGINAGNHATAPRLDHVRQSKS